MDNFIDQQSSSALRKHKATWEPHANYVIEHVHGINLNMKIKRVFEVGLGANTNFSTI